MTDGGSVVCHFRGGATAHYENYLAESLASPSLVCIASFCANQSRVGIARFTTFVQFSQQHDWPLEPQNCAHSVALAIFLSLFVIRGS